MARRRSSRICAAFALILFGFTIGASGEPRRDAEAPPPPRCTVSERLRLANEEFCRYLDQRHDTLEIIDRVRRDFEKTLPKVEPYARVRGQEI